MSFGVNGVTTTLTNAIGASDLQFKVGSTTGFPAVGVIGSRQLLRIDGEDMLIDLVPVSGTVKVAMRGYNGTTAVAHDILAAVMTSSTPSDFGDVPVGAVDTRPPYVDDIVTIGEDITFTAAGTAPVSGTSMPLPIKNTTYLITKASAASITIISASPAQAGVRMTFIAGTAQAHTVTYTPGFLGDTTSSDVATFGSKVGAAMTVEVGYTGLLSATALATVTLG